MACEHVSYVLGAFGVERGAVDAVTTGDGHRRLRSVAPAVAVVHLPTGTRDVEVVLLWRLVVDTQDRAESRAAERVLGSRVRVSAGALDGHVHLPGAGPALNAIQRTVKVGVKGANEAVRGDAGGASGSKGVAWK